MSEGENELVVRDARWNLYWTGSLASPWTSNVACAARFATAEEARKAFDENRWPSSSCIKIVPAGAPAPVDPVVMPAGLFYPKRQRRSGLLRTEQAQATLVMHATFCASCKITVEQVLVKAGTSWPDGCSDPDEFVWKQRKPHEWELCVEGRGLLAIAVKATGTA